MACKHYYDYSVSKISEYLTYNSCDQREITRELNAKRNVCTCVPEQTLRSKPRESTPISDASCNKKEGNIDYQLVWKQE